jgi:GNAT superfamily N-acetyltransferase
MAIVYRDMVIEELPRLAEIDRGEEIQSSYVLQNNELVLVGNAESVPGFTAAELAELDTRQAQLLANGGKVIGAFEQDLLAGIASAEKELRGERKNYCKMDILYVSKPQRGKGIAKQLLQEIKACAKEFGATHLYISATPTQHTVDFYLAQGAQLAATIDEELWALEPDDIHLELSLLTSLPKI